MLGMALLKHAVIATYLMGSLLKFAFEMQWKWVRQINTWLAIKASLYLPSKNIMQASMRTLGLGQQQANECQTYDPRWDLLIAICVDCRPKDAL